MFVLLVAQKERDNPMVTALSTLRTDIWTAVYNLLQSNATWAITTNNIYSSFNTQLVSSVGYPIVIVYSPDINFEKLSANGYMMDCKVGILIEIYEDNAKDCKTVADQVTRAIIGGRISALADAGLTTVNIAGSGVDTWQEGTKTIHRISISLTGRYVGTTPTS